MSRASAATHFAVVLLAYSGAMAAESPTLPSAREHLRHGEYDPARDEFAALLQSNSSDALVAAAIGLSEALAATGEYAAAKQAIVDALTKQDESADLWGRLAELQFATGQWTEARASADAAVQRDTDALRARLIKAHLLRESGELTDALTEYRWFVRYYNRVQPTDAATLLSVAEGSLEYARWKNVNDIFHFVVNTLCPDALKDDPDDWRIWHLSGELLLEKYNRPEAESELTAALEINPHAAEVHEALARLALQDADYDTAAEHAERALAINPRLVPALVTLARIALQRDETGTTAADYVTQAEAVNPLDQSVLATRAMCLLLESGWPAADRLEACLGAFAARGELSLREPTQFETLVLELAARNPKAGRFLNELGEFFESRRKYAHAELAFRTAVAVMPELAEAKTNLGFIYMRTGRLEDAQRLLDEAFEADPFHVRVSNMRKVLGVLGDYQVIRTEHFSIRVDPADAELGAYMAEYLEELHAELAPLYGYEPALPTQFEIYSSAQGQTAHEWFSARMVGLPWIQTIGASTGMIVAMASPQSLEEPFHWGRVLRHEYVHILTLQQTDFNIPHWFTEALAVRSEGMLLPAEWQTLLERRSAEGNLFNLRTILQGFQAPENQDDWDIAYCQSRLYAHFIEETWGAPALFQLLDAYRRGLATPAAIEEVCGIPEAEFETQYSAWLEELVDRIRQSRATPVIDVTAAQVEADAAPNDAALRGRLAFAQWQAGDTNAAQLAAEQALALDPREPLANVVLAESASEDGDAAAGLERLIGGFNADDPHPVLLAKLGSLAFNAGDLAKSAEFFEMGVQTFPLEDEFWKGLTVAYLSLGADDKVGPILTELAQRDSDNREVRRKLAQLALTSKDFDNALRWAREVLFIDLDDADAHALLGQAWLGKGDSEKSRQELTRALAQDDACLAAFVGLAELELQSGNPTAAWRQIERALAIDSAHAQALDILSRIEALEFRDP
jgi:tetratricopeptide (TPR) repeat protein